MSETFDDAVDAAWGQFGTQLREALETLEEGVILTIAVPGPGPEEELQGRDPGVELTRFGGDIFAEITSVHWLDCELELGADQITTLESLGWSLVDLDEGPAQLVGDYATRASRDELGALVWSLIETMRHVFDVVSPEFLDWTAPSSDEDEDEFAFEHFVRSPEDRNGLVEMVRAAIEGYQGGGEVVVDEDGDFPVRHGSAVVFVQIAAAAPVVQMYSPMAIGVRRRAQAAIEVNLLNARVPGIKFVLSDAQVTASLDLPSLPFSSQQFFAALTHISHCVDELDDDLVVRVGGVPFFEDEEC